MFASVKLSSNILKAAQCACRNATKPHFSISRNISSTAARRNLLQSWNRNVLIVPKRITLNAAVIRCMSTSLPEKGRKLVGGWLLGCSGMVFVAVVLGATLGYLALLYSVMSVVGIVLETVTKGGVTRLTESGLSMVTWKLLGEKRPTTPEEWQEEFDKYKQYPEFKLKNSSMTLEEFKWIYWMEYGHRMWGRAIGAFYAIPAIYFWTRGYFSKAMKPRILIFGALIGAQGLMGWYMVKSGLEDRFHGESDVPRVSQYRLATHLTFAFVLYTLFLWSSLSHLLPAERLSQVTRGAIRFRKLAHVTKGMIFLTAFSGAFVAGLDAGLVYNSFPKMGDEWIPSDVLAINPTIRNFTENPTTVQLDHRILGITTLSLISGLWLLSKRRVLPRRAHFAANAVALMGWTQVGLGILTLLNYVPVSLAAAHQSGSLVLLSLAVWLTHELKLVKYLPK